MTVTKGVALSLFVAAASGLATLPGRASGGSTTAPRLTAIPPRDHGTGPSLVTGAPARVLSAATRPDPLTVFVDFRNVGADGLANSVSAHATSPIAAVNVEPVEALGAPASRVRIVLTHPVEYRVRSSRNTIVLDFDKPKAGPYIVPALRSTGVVADAMKALEQPTTAPADPIAALGLDRKAEASAPVHAPVAAALPPKGEAVATRYVPPPVTPAAKAAPEPTRYAMAAATLANVENAGGQAAGSATVRPTAPPPQ